MRKLAAGLGLLDFPFETARGYWRWVDLCEAEGADSLWYSDRLIGEIPVLECISALAALAGRTRRLKFGMNVLSLALRDPVLTAKQCATIDLLSEGRLLPAFGIGSPRAPEWLALGLDTAGRGQRTDEALTIMSRLWAGETLDFAGQHFRLSGVTIRPLPAQSTLPLWIGGSSPAAIRRTARLGTGWQGGIMSPEEIRPVVAAIAAAAAAEGRPIDADHYGTAIFFRFGSLDDPAAVAACERLRQRLGIDPAAALMTGDAADMLVRIAEFARAGIAKFILVPVGQGDEDLLAQTSRLLAEVVPRVPGL
jgi:probable F420-dependent oxidoreductase